MGLQGRYQAYIGWKMLFEILYLLLNGLWLVGGVRRCEPRTHDVGLV